MPVQASKKANSAYNLAEGQLAMVQAKNQAQRQKIEETWKLQRGIKAEEVYLQLTNTLETLLTG